MLREQRRATRALFSLVVLAGSIGGCSLTSDPSPGGSGSGSGAAGPGYVPATCDQACKDYFVAYGLNRTLWFLWNQKIAGQPSGAKDLTGSCPLGGTVHITGTTAVSTSTGINTNSLLFELTGCEHSSESYTLSFTGSVQMEGSFDSSTEFAAETFSASPLDVSGSLSWLDGPAIAENCDVMFSQEGLGKALALSGRVCGRDFNQDSLYPTGTGSPGAGGSSSSGGGTGGGSSSNCACFCPDNRDCTNSTDPNPCGVDADGIPEPCGCPVDCP